MHQHSHFRSNKNVYTVDGRVMYQATFQSYLIWKEKQIWKWYLVCVLKTLCVHFSFFCIIIFPIIPTKYWIQSKTIIRVPQLLRLRIGFQYLNIEHWTSISLLSNYKYPDVPIILLYTITYIYTYNELH